MPASSNSLTVRYTVEIEILSSTATQRRYSSSTSGWSAASASTRAMTRRCSVIRMPVAAQRASIPVGLSADVDFSAVIGVALQYSASIQSIASGLTRGCKRLDQEKNMCHLITGAFIRRKLDSTLADALLVPCATARASRQVAAH